MAKQKKTGKVKSPIKKQLDEVEKYFKELNSDIETKINTSPNNKEIAFGISLKSKKVSRNWNKVQKNLSNTLKSIFRNTDQHFRVVIAGHNKPTIKELRDKRVKWLPVKFSSPTSPKGFTQDKMRKRRKIGEYLYKVGFSGYFMAVDADDWIHHRFVEYIRSQPFSNAFILEKGLITNIGRKEIWETGDFYKKCGTNALFYFSKKDFPNPKKKKGNIFATLTLKAHPKSPDRLKKLNKDYKMITLPFVIWVLSHGDNNSMLKGNKDPGISAKDYGIQGEKLEDWFYKYFRTK
ncbi:hypothetical protein H7S55_16990 [Priestia aryabhattai]|uniref:hypothetical protein n=1 Tax=Priestia aryabhattai TaxID=412384 RepID=UPI001C8E4134|nr:hypothetical protein [Priestia aryabhattai]MBY0001875.1 hypothetical protein [Priestia aryabhattai]